MNTINSTSLGQQLEIKNHSYSGYLFQEPILSNNGFILKPSITRIIHDKLPYQNTFWSDKCFNEIQLPVQAGTLNKEDQFNFSFANDLRILDLPIKFSNSDIYRVPSELKQFESVIKRIIDYEHSTNPDLNDRYCYLTVDQKLLKPHQYTRKSGLHVDGFQGARIPKPLKLDHSYILYDCFPPLFYNQAFKVMAHWNKSCHDYFKGFELQIDPAKIVTYEPYQILLINAYCLHNTITAPLEKYRTFFRLSYTVREFDRLGNAHNPLFDYHWNMIPRDTQSTLECPI